VYKHDVLTGVSTQLAALPGIVDSMALNHQGRLFAAQLAPISALWEIDPQGVNPPRLVTTFIGGMDGIDTGPDGHVYTPDFFGGSGAVRRINVDTGEVTVVAVGLEAPIAAKFNGQGELHVAEYFQGLILCLDLATGAKTPVARELPGLDNFDFDLNDRIYTANIGDNSIKQLHGFGPFRWLSRPGMGTPGPIVVRQKFGLDVVYVSDTFSLRKLLGLTGITLDQTLVSPLPTELSLVQSLWDDGTHFITTSFITNLVQVWDPVTKHVVMASQTFQVPMNAIRFQGELAVAELGSGQVVRGSDRLPYITNLTIPTGLAATAEDLYVADFATGTIYQAVKDGVIQHPPLIVAQHLVAPEGMAIDNDGNLLVAETGRQRLVRIDPVTHHLDVIADDLAIGFLAIVGWPPTGQVLTGVAVSPSGTIYVAGDVDNVVYRIQKTH